jgi:hypothetical protein
VPTASDRTDTVAAFVAAQTAELTAAFATSDAASAR